MYMCVLNYYGMFLFRTITHTVFKSLGITERTIALQFITKTTIELLDIELDKLESSMTVVEESMRIGNPSHSVI